MPRISIITVTYNAEKVLERTLKSILNQSNQNFEYLIIDGKSSDSTLSICEAYKSRIDKIISENDAGIYDAMNKGIDLANGDFVWFMNAGDEIASSDIIEKIYQDLNSETDLIYGDALFVNESGKIRGKRSELTPHKLHSSISWQDLKYGMLVCHQSLIVSKRIAPHFLLDNLSADIDWEIKSFKDSKAALFCNFSLSKYLEGGVSNQQLQTSLIDRFKILKMHFGLFPTLWNHLYILGRGMITIWTNKGKYW